MDKQLLQLFKAVNTPLVRFNEPMNLQTTFRIGGPAEVFIVPQTIHQLQAAYNLCRSHKTPVHVIGDGSNLLVSDKGVRGAVIKITNREFIRRGSLITVGAGYRLPALITRTMKLGLSGLETLAGIPGTIGGAVAMNAGGKYGNISDTLKSVTVMDKQGNIRILKKPDIKFGYRTSGILKAGHIVYMVTLGLKKSRPATIRKRLSAILRAKRATQPLAAWSAGCVFKNPSKLSAGALIDQAGLKGKTIGNAMVSPKHANFIVNSKNARASDVRRLINLVKKTIYKKYGIKLGLEIQIW